MENLRNLELVKYVNEVITEIQEEGYTRSQIIKDFLKDTYNFPNLTYYVDQVELYKTYIHDFIEIFDYLVQEHQVNYLDFENMVHTVIEHILNVLLEEEQEEE